MKRLAAALVLMSGLIAATLCEAVEGDISAPDQQKLAQFLRPARDLAQKGDVRQALAAAETAADQVSSQFGESGQWAQAYVLDDLARFRALNQDFVGAHTASAKATVLAQQAFGNSARAAYFYESNSNLSNTAGDCTSALSSALAAVDTYAATEGPQNADTRRAAIGAAILLLRKGDLKSAREIAQRSFDESHLTDLSTGLLFVRLSIEAGDLSHARSVLDRLAGNLGQSDNLQSRAILAIARSQLLFASADLAGSENALRETLANDRLASQFPSEWIQAVQQIALLQALKGEFADALANYGRAFQMLSKRYAPNAVPMALVNHNLGWVYRMLGDYKQAEYHFELSLKASDQCYGGPSYLALNTLFERTRLYLDLGRTAEALSSAQRSVHDAELVGVRRDLMRSYALAARALVQRRLGRLEDAQRDQLDSIKLIKDARGVESWDMAPGYTELADIALARSDLDHAREWATAALAIRERDAANSMWATGLPIAQLMDVAAARGQWAEVNARAERIVSITQQRLSAVQAGSSAVVDELRRSRDLVERLFDDFSQMPPAEYASKRSVQTLFAAVQLPHLTSLASVLRVSEGGGRFDERQKNLIATRRGLLDQLQAVQSELQAGAKGELGTLVSSTIQSLLSKSIELENSIANTDRELERTDPQLAEMIRPSLESLQLVQSLLRPDEAIYVQVVTETHTHGVLIRQRDAVFRSSTLNRSTLRRHVSRLRRGLDLGLRLEDRLPFDYAAAHELYAGTLGQFDSELAQIHDLNLVLDDALQNIPPAVLVKNLPAGATDATFLGEQFGIAVQPSLSTFRILRARDKVPTGRSFVGYGDPILKGAVGGDARSANRLAGANLDAQDLVASLPALPETAQELRGIASALAADSSAVHIQAEATEAAVKSARLSDYRVLSFATHGLLAGDFRGLAQPALVLTPPAKQSTLDDGLLTASEVAQLSLKADLVILSACNTGRADEGAGAVGLSALARGFFFAGANSLIVSHWAVSSEATVALITEALRLMSSQPGLTKAQALRSAMAHLRQGSLGAQFTSPSYWAPFVLIGDDRPLVR